MLPFLRQKFSNAIALISLLPEEKRYAELVENMALPAMRPARGRRVFAQWSWDPFIWLRLLPVLFAMKRAGWEIGFVDHAFYTVERTFRQKLRTYLERLRWRKLYRIPRLGQIALDLMGPPSRATRARARKLLDETIASKSDIFNIHLGGTPVGDLIYDTYLRNKPAARVDIADPMLTEVVARAIHVQEICRKVFEGPDRPDVVLTPYCVYLNHGILVREALRAKVRVYSLGFSDPALKPVEAELPIHLRNYTRYRRAFRALPPETQRAGLAEARDELERRLRGNIDATISFMTSSAYASANAALEARWLETMKAEKKRKVVLFLHCFFDSPHLYRDMLFDDFWDWALFLVREFASLRNVQLYLKPHPNGLPGNEPMIAELMTYAGNAVLLPKEISNNLFSKAGFVAALSVYGTVAHELPYVGIPVINAGDNPHADYSFCLNAKSREELANVIRQIDQGTYHPAIDREEICEFYYMHNLYPQRGRLPAHLRAMNSVPPFQFNMDTLKAFAMKPAEDLEAYCKGLVSVADELFEGPADDPRP